MENDKLKDLFNHFEPELPSSRRFMSRLEERLETVEFVRHSVASRHRRNKKALIISGCVGFVFGIIASWAYPYVLKLITGFLNLLPNINSLRPDGTDQHGMVGVLITFSTLCLLGCILTYSTYDIFTGTFLKKTENSRD